MKKLYYFLPFLFIIISLFISCDETNQDSSKEKAATVTKSLNPNGNSELAMLMRGMYEEAERVKEQIKKGEEPTLQIDHGKILTAHATEPEKANSKEFKDFAKMYLSNLDQLQKANKDNVEMVFQSLVESCMSCHQQLCPGPMVRIKKLRVASN